MDTLIGQPAPDLTFGIETGERIRLSALRGQNVMLAFYTRDHGNN